MAGAGRDDLTETLLQLEREDDADFRRRALWELIRLRVRGPRVLDVGAGAGQFTFRLIAEGLQVVALEPTPALLEGLKAAARRRGVAVDARPLGVHELESLGEARFDTVVCLDVIEHVEDDRAALRELAGRLAPAGRLVLTVPAGPALYGARDAAIGHYRRYDAGELRAKVEAAGLRIQELRYWNLLGVAPYFVFEKLLGRPVADGLRRPGGSRLRRLAGSAIYRLLQLENRVALPRGLTLVVVATREPRPA